MMVIFSPRAASTQRHSSRGRERVGERLAMPAA
jgi:hypothetical protein